jgi:predicted dehydrogenase
MMTQITRRDFTAGAAVAGLAAMASTTRSQEASNRIRLGFIGLGNRGDQVLDAFLAHPDAQVVAICDIYQPYLDFASHKIGTEPTQHKDYRKLLDRKDVDAVVICTPDHWHAIMTIHACEAGKDVYVEKPLSLCVAEGRKMIDAVRKHDRVCQVGIHRRSSKVCHEAAEFIRTGGIGKVTVARAFHIQNEWPKGIGRPEDTQPPEGFDWDAWLGPAPWKPYNVNRTFYRFRWFWDYSGGQVTNFGVHYLDMIQWALGKDAPKSVVAMGGKFADYDDREVPDTCEAMWTYPDKTLVTFSQFNASSPGAAARPCDIEFRGTEGTLYFTDKGFDVVPESITPNEFSARTPLDRAREKGWRTGAKPMIEPRKERGPQDTAAHARNFLDCVRSRKRCNCDVEIAHRSTSACLLANIALRTGAMIQWDPSAERITSSEQANKMLSHEYRKPYQI